MTITNQEPNSTLNVIVIDDYDVYGIYHNEYLKQAMINLYNDLKAEIDKHYTIEEQLEYHYDDLNQMLKFIKNDTLDFTDVVNLKNFLTIYNELTPNKYSVEQLNVNEDDEPIIVDYINDYGFDNYKAKCM
ncbi:MULTISPECIES: hypothetical protein [Staphylococcus]|uniref:hypothetical protein n=1 Tax=Staphylococcus TaxID=1279 RepID=UPI0011A16FF1|nr:hypothetical protein [Staphylococcus hominis]MCG1130669.1 hypothetical protein [Staphylococcus epidermidis]